MRINHNILFMVVWSLMAAISLFLAADAKELEKTNLAIYAPEFPKERNLVFANGPSITDVIRDIAQSHNKNVELLERSMHQSAKTSFMVNILSFVLSLAGLLAQFCAYRYEKRKGHATINVIQQGGQLVKPKPSEEPIDKNDDTENSAGDPND